VRVKILEIDSERRRLSLSIKRVEGQVLPVRPIEPPTSGDTFDDVPELGLSEDVFASSEDEGPSAATEVLDPAEIAEADVSVDPDAGVPDAPAEAEADAAPEAMAEPEAEAAPEAVAEPEAEAVAEPEAEAAPEAAVEPEAEAAPEAAVEPEAEAAPEAAVEPEAAAEAEVEAASEQPAAEADADPDAPSS
jgi:small subunit ribosomal protein S1